MSASNKSGKIIDAWDLQGPSGSFRVYMGYRPQNDGDFDLTFFCDKPLYAFQHNIAGKILSNTLTEGLKEEFSGRVFDRNAITPQFIHDVLDETLCGSLQDQGLVLVNTVPYDEDNNYITYEPGQVFSSVAGIEKLVNGDRSGKVIDMDENDVIEENDDENNDEISEEDDFGEGGEEELQEIDDDADEGEGLYEEGEMPDNGFDGAGERSVGHFLETEELPVNERVDENSNTGSDNSGTGCGDSVDSVSDTVIPEVRVKKKRGPKPKHLKEKQLQAVYDSARHNTADVPMKDENGNINCINCKDCYNCVNCRNCQGCVGCVNCMDCVDGNDLINCSNCRLCYRCKHCMSLAYCMLCIGCNHISYAVSKSNSRHELSVDIRQ